MKKTLVFFWTVSILISISFFIVFSRIYAKDSIKVETLQYAVVINKNCSDGTMHNSCATQQPMFCKDGILQENPTKCGCPPEQIIHKGSCYQTCSDGTPYGECSSERKPNQCVQGKYVQNASLCGCPMEYEFDGMGCSHIYKKGVKNVELKYVLDGQTGMIKITMYEALRNKTLVETLGNYESNALSIEEAQRKYLTPLIEKIKEKSNSKAEQARIALSIVQNIPYDYNLAGGSPSMVSGVTSYRSPYAVIFDNRGICYDKAKLALYLLGELKIGGAILSYSSENHAALGISCTSTTNTIGNSGYCFAETTVPSIMCDDGGNIANVGKLKTMPAISEIQVGDIIDISEECKDGLRYKEIKATAEANNNLLEEDDWDDYVSLRSKYGLKE